MAHPYMTYYLLELATDANELAQFNNAKKDQRVKMGQKKGLNLTQSEDLAGADPNTIMNDVLAELNQPPPAGGTHYTIQLALDLQPCKKNDG